MKQLTSPRLVVVLVAAVLGVSAGAQQNNEEFARRQYESGMSFLQNHRYSEALKDLQAVVDTFATSSVADNALLQIAQYQLENAHDLDAAQTSVDKLLKDFPDTDSAPMAHVLSGRIAFTKGRTPADVDAALAALRARPPALSRQRCGGRRRLLRRGDPARRAARRRGARPLPPRDDGVSAVDLGGTRQHLRRLLLIQQDKASQALQEFQRARTVPEHPAATEALNFNSIAYRLYVRAPAQPAYASAERRSGRNAPNFATLSASASTATVR